MSEQNPAPPAGWRTPMVIIIAGCLISLIGYGGRSIFGLFLEPMTAAVGWDRTTFSMAMAIQNLLWGIGVPIAGAFADKFGARLVLAFGAAVYAVGIIGMAVADSAFMLHFTGGVLVGLGVAFSSFAIAVGAMAKVVSEDQRSFVLGLGMAAGSAGQVVFSPIGVWMITAFGWFFALQFLAVSVLIIIPLALLLPGQAGGGAGNAVNLPQQTIPQALREAVSHRGYILLTVGFFVCGFHVSFVAVHLPAYVQDLGLSAQVGGYALALIGLFNIIGSLGAGLAGQKWSKKNSLCLLYFARAILIAGLLFAPKTALTIYLFSIILGLLWLSTVPLTTGIVAQVFGVRYMTMLFGIVFLSHQVGSFIGVYMGGYLFDQYGTYDPIWWAAVALGIAAGFIHLLIDERPLARLKAAPA